MSIVNVNDSGGAGRMGVYFCANDRALPWAEGFLESFRQFNPTLPLVLFPFDDRVDRLAKLASSYDVKIQSDPAFAALEEIGRSIGMGKVSYGHHWFRRLAAFWGEFDHFLYLDSDIVVLSDLSRMLEALRRTNYDLLHCDCVMSQVYLPGELLQRMVRQRAHGFNSGTWGARRGVFSLAELQRFAQEAQPLLPQLNTQNSDQCFLNFCCDSKGISYAAFADVMERVSPITFARIGEIYPHRGHYYHWDHSGNDHNTRVLMLHWAGIKRDPAMPHANLFLRFSLARKDAMSRMWTRAKWWTLGFFYRAADRIRRSRRFNAFYHRLRARLFGHALPDRLAAIYGEADKPAM